MRTRRILKQGSVPSIFPNCPHYLSNPSQPRNQNTSSAKRHENVQERQDATIQQFFAEERFQTLEEMKIKMAKLDFARNVFQLNYDDTAVFAKILKSEQVGPSILFSLVLDQDLKFDMFCQGIKVPNSMVSSITKQSFLHSTTQITNILAFLGHYHETRTASIDHVKNSVDALTHLLDQSMNVPDESGCKVQFAIEQLRLALISKSSRRYSSNLLAMAVLWNNTSPNPYKQILAENILSVPSQSHLASVSRPCTVETGLPSKTISYLEARIKGLNIYQTQCLLLIDEIYTSAQYEYAGGKFFGAENGEATKTLLCFMIKSLASSQRDVVALIPVVKISAELIHQHLLVVLKSISKIGYNVIGLSVDNHSANRKLYTSILCTGSLQPWIPHPCIPGEKLFLLFDSVHNFKNIYNNFVNRKSFSCPRFQESGPKTMMPRFAHIEALKVKESSKAIKMAHKLSDKVLKPTTIERTNVKLADSLFHESTINGLIFHQEKHPEWEDTVKFLQLIRKYWNIVNVKSTTLGRKKRNPDSDPIKLSNTKSLDFLRAFETWITSWRDECGTTSLSLTRETFGAVIQTTRALVELAEHLLEEKSFNYVLLGNCQSDDLEERFGWYRQLCGANYFVSVRQVLEAEKTIRLKSLVKFSKMNMKEIGNTFADGENVREDNETEILIFVSMVEDPLYLSCKEEDDSNIIFYVAGYVSKTVAKLKKSCQFCLDLLFNGNEEIAVQFDNSQLGEGSFSTAMKDRFIDQVSRGGLKKPSDIVFLSCIHIWNLYNIIMSNEDLKFVLLSSKSPRALFCETLQMKMDEREETMVIKSTLCGNGHKFSDILSRISLHMFNLMAKNFTQEVNEVWRSEKKRRKPKDSGTGPGPTGRKIKKLQSD